MKENYARLVLLAIGTLLVLAFLATSCSPNDFITSQGDTIVTLQKAGHTDIKLGGINVSRCGPFDKRGRDFAAINPEGGQSTGTVCCGFSPIAGIGKGCYIRY